MTLIGVTIAAFVFESYFGSSRYYLNGSGYVVPHKYEFNGRFNLSWLASVYGLDKEPNESVWLMFPAEELARDISGYSRWFHGYSDQIEADVVVNVLGGKEAREFPDDRVSDIREVSQQLAQKSPRLIDPSGWERIYWSVGNKGTPGEGSDLFYLIPRAGLNHMPANWRVPSCQSSPDIDGKETYTCYVTVYSGGMSFGFYVRSENLMFANRIANYTHARLVSWRR